jgi:hypothetical protein
VCPQRTYPCYKVGMTREEPELTQKVELLFAYSPDVPWVAEQMQKMGGNKDALKLAEIVEQRRGRYSSSKRVLRRLPRRG